MKHRITLIGLSISLLFGAFSAVSFSSKQNYQEVRAVLDPPSKTYTNGDADTYYVGITDDMMGDNLLATLRSLNKNRRKTTVGYDDMGTTPSGLFRYTDYDPSTVTYDSNGQPYGTKLTSFYSGNSATSGMNREHVWPKSHGGNLVEADIHMPRPTIIAENGSRGNSFYVEGKKDGKYGWDPAMESFGKESYRGDSARIIFYCVIANSSLSLTELEYHETSNANRDNLMGKLSDMVKWHLNYEPTQREMNRNEGAEYLQGNRNPFIDHPEYVCRIWGNVNDETKALCQGHIDKVVTIKSGSTELQAADLAIDSSITFDAYVDGTKENNVTWSFENEDGSEYVGSAISHTIEAGSLTVTAVSEGQLYVKAAYTYDDKTVSKRIKLTCYSVPEVRDIEIVNLPTKTSYEVGDSLDLTGLKVNAILDDSTVDVTSEVTVSPTVLSEAGEEIEITVSYNDGTNTFTDTFTVTVSEPESRILSYIVINKAPDKVVYNLGETLDLTGIVVTAHYENGHSEDVSDMVSTSVSKLESTGNVPIVVQYTEGAITETAVFRVKVNGPAPATKGCGGNIVATSIVLALLSISGVIAIAISSLVRRRKHEK